MSTHNRKTIGILGGTFDPIHFGHLRAAIEIYEHLNLDEIRLIPCRFPPHKTTPMADAHHRLTMIRKAVQGTKLQVDECEIEREPPSYSVDTLMALRRTYPEASLCMIVGADTFIGLPQWHQWEKLIQLTNIVVTHRGDPALPKKGIIKNFLEKHALATHESIRSFTAGRIIQQRITQLDISSTQIRNIIHTKLSPHFLLPSKVWEYIQTQGLYGYNKNFVAHTHQEEITRR